MLYDKHQLIEHIKNTPPTKNNMFTRYFTNIDVITLWQVVFPVAEIT
jgi:hypothetical protein